GLYFTLLVIANVGAHFIDVEYAKGRKLQAERFSKWNRISRVGVGQDGSLSIDGIAVGKIANFNPDHLKPEELPAAGASAVYRLHPGARTLVIGADGGLNVARALASGSRDVTVVEANPILASTVMREKFAELSDRLYLRPDVHVQVDDGRSFLRGNAEKYQLIHVTLPEAGAWTEAGVVPFAAARMATPEAFGEYFAHLTPDGVVVLTGREVSQVMEPAARALNDLGQAIPELHLDGDGETAKTVIFRRSAVPRVAFPSTPPMGTAAEAASDDKPFLHSLSPLRPEATPAVIAAIGILVGILVWGAWLSRTHGAGGALPYFPVIGLGAVIVQVALVHDFVLYFGRPTYALTTVTFSLLLWNAAGSFASRWMLADRAVRLRVALAVAAGMVGATAFALRPMLTRSNGMPLAVKIAIAALLIAPAGFMTGLPFPAGLGMLGRRHEGPVRWAWALHAAAGVLGSVAALGLAVQFGITMTMLIGAGCYLVALGVAARGWLVRTAG
ncbi:MAG TPA: hypothetical protein VNH18_33515, partial [Bryobacteraceae bacterium]|nr:hypothetical protein [Bryobacteraceae bacterium]